MAKDKEEKETVESLDAQLKQMAKELDITIGRFSDMETKALEAIHSGSFALDFALGVGGYPRGRIIEMYGVPSGGKSTLSLLAIASAQKNGGEAALIDSENAFDPEWGTKLGVDVDRLIYFNPENGEEALQTIEKLVQTNNVDIVVVDSVAALVPKIEMENDLGQQTMGVQARMLSQGLRRLTGAIARSKAVVIFINQLRQKIGGFSPGGVQFTTPGGESLKFYASQRLEVKKLFGSDLKDGEAVLGHRVGIKVVKNKVAPPFRTAEFQLKFTEGIDKIDDLVSLATKTGIIVQGGPMYKFGELSIKGMEKLVETVRADEKLQESLWKAIQENKK
jgi:recombination protein RecA